MDRRGGLAGLGGLDGGLHERVGVGLAQGGDLNHGAAELLGEGVGIDLVAALLEEVEHVEAEDDRQAALEDLRGEVEVTLEVRRVDEVDDGLRAVLNQVVARDDLLGRVRRKRINAGKVGEGDGLVATPRGLLLLDRDAGPVADVAVRARQGVEQRGLAAVRVACERNVHAVFHDSLSSVAGGGVGPLGPPARAHCQSARAPLSAMPSPDGSGAPGRGCDRRVTSRVPRPKATTELLGVDFDLVCLVLADGQLVATDVDLDGIAKRGHLDHLDLGALGEAHVHDAALDGAGAGECLHRAR